MSVVTNSVSPQEAIYRQMRERRIVDQVGRIGLAFFLLLTAVIYVVMPLQAASWISQTPFLGVFVEYPASVNFDDTLAFLPADSQPELHNMDTIVGVDGIPVQYENDIYDVLRRHAAGETVQLEVKPAQGGDRRQVSVTLRRFPLNMAISLFAVPYIVGIAYIAIGLWVHRNRRDQALGRIFLLLCCSIAIILATLFDTWTSHNFNRIWNAAFPWGTAMLIAFGLLFPTELPLVARRPLIRWVPLLIVAVPLIIWGQIVFYLPPSRVPINPFWNVMYITTAIGMIGFLLSLFLRSFLAPSPSVREQCRVALVGSLFAFLPFVAGFVFPVVDIPVGWILVLLLCFPLVIAYSIVQYSVLDTGRALSFTATYSAMGILATVGYWLVVAGLLVITTASVDTIAAQPALIGLLAFVLVAGFQPLRARLQQLLDDFFFRTRSEYQERLTNFRHELTQSTGLGEVVRLLKQQIRETLRPTHTYVFLRDPNSNNFIAVGEGSRPDTDIRFETQSGLVHALSTTRDIIFLEFNKPLPPELVEEHARLAVLRTPILAPLQGQERLAGWVAVSNKRSGEVFTVQDLRFIQALAEQASLAVERAQVIGDLERRVRELDVLSQVSQAVNFTADPDVLMELIYAQASKLLDTTNFYIITHNAPRGALSYAFFLEGDERYQEREGEIWPDNIGLASEVIRTGRPIVTEDYRAECAFRNVDPGDGRHYAWLGVPLNAGAATLGTMVVGSYTQGVVFTDDQLKVFWAIADQAASALDKARLFREIETRARQLATLNDISKELSSTLELENLLERIMKSAVDILGVEAGSLFLITEDTGDLVFRVVEGGAQNLVGTRIPSGKGIVGEAANTGNPVIVNNVLQDGRWFSNVDRETAFQTQSLLAVPLRIQDRSIGVIEVINKKDMTPFGDEDASLLTTFAAQAAVAIENARLYEATDAELSARVDELQNLQRIDRELNRTLRFDRVIRITLDWALRTTGASAGAIAMLDVDNTGVEIVTSAGYPTELMETQEGELLPKDKGIVGRVLSSGKPDFSTNLENDPDYLPLGDNKSIAQITVPILRANQPIGSLVLESDIPGLLTTQDFEFVQRLVEHAAVAIENARLVQEIESANRAKTDFISFVSHELKNPMTSIRGYTDLLKGGQVGPVTDMQAQFLATIRANVDRMTRLVSDLADVARIESGHLKLEMSPISVNAVVEETLRGLQGQIEEKQQELSVDMDEELPPIFADHTRMVQVLTNLVSNAHKYTPDGGKIWVGAQVEAITNEETGQAQRMIHHWVRDTGIGMAPEDLEKLFTKFFRTQQGKDMAQGTGLGLNITKSLVDRHGGTIWVESEVGAGTTFHYTIPVATEEAQSQQQEAAD
ncbi:MAG: GAF domain-containing protein [Anaerolineae bacterium]|nr:GAF domain-containing protein [Anaerolineae bacterium]